MTSIAAARLAAPVKCALAATLAGVLGLTAPAAIAQDAKKQTPPAVASPVGTWTGSVSKEAAVAGITLDDKQVAAVKKVNAYFNGLNNLKGSFLQFNPDGKRLRGKFSMKRPGKFRFDYGSGSKLVIISDGTNLAIQDNDLNTESNYMLDQTPFRILLRNDVDVLRDGKVLDVQESDDLIIFAVQDKSPDTPGKIRLFLAKKPQGLEIKEWVTTDAQGLDTRVEVSEINRTDEIDAGLFKIESLVLKRLQ